MKSVYGITCRECNSLLSPFTANSCNCGRTALLYSDVYKNGVLIFADDYSAIDLVQVFYHKDKIQRLYKLPPSFLWRSVYIPTDVFKNLHRENKKDSND